MDKFKKAEGIISQPGYVHTLKSLEELLKRDEQRKEDGFPKEIRLGKMIRPSDQGGKKIVVIPTVDEEKCRENRSCFAEEIR